MRPLSLLAFLPSLLTLSQAGADEHQVITWEKRHLDRDFYAEGASFGDIDRDGHLDVVSGPFIWLGPDFDHKLSFYKAEPVDPKGYSHNFFSFTHDFNGDDWLDILVLGFPGRDSRWFENPGETGGSWQVHTAMERTDNESPTFVDLTGDGRPEIVCSIDGELGYASPDPEKPREPFHWHPLSPPNAVGGHFTHGLGVGDVNGDGRLDVLEKERWWEQPSSLQGDPEWKSHRFALATPGGAQMYAYDFDGDGDNDILTSLAAHAYGLAWYEQVADPDGGSSLEQRLIMGQDPLENPYGLAFSQMHGIALADIDGDGVQDIVTGKRYWAHGGKDPGGQDPAVLYWFRTVRTAEGVDFRPYQIDDDSGVGTEVKVGDLNKDGYLDIIVGNKKGTFIHFQKRRMVDRETWLDAQPLKAFLPDIPSMDAYAAGHRPQDAAAAMTLPEGFTATLLASEPDLTQPITFCFDDRGRLWVAEAHNYPFPAKEGQGKDRILIFEDADADGTWETRKVFAEGLSLISGLEVGFGGVWVGAAPYFLFIPDHDRNDIPDAEPQILLDGWGLEDTHETLNSFSWGPDGWLYGLHGVFTHSNVGKPGTADEDRTFLNCAVWRYHPVRHSFEVFSTGTSNPWGLDFDEHGQAFISACVIPHLWHMIQGGYYERQGGQHQRKHLYELIDTIARHRHYAGNVADHAHWGHTPTADIVGGDTFARGGGHAHCGLTIYRGDTFPDRYRDALLMFNLHGHRINWDHVQRQGADYYGDRRPDFLFANDHWFIGTHLDYGPDGALYFTDWQDDTTCHRQSDLEWDRTNGRLFRVHYGEHQPVRIDLHAASDEALADYQTHKNEWFARTARRVLQERAVSRSLTPEAARRLRDLLAHHPDIAIRLRSLWTLHAAGLALPQLPSLMADADSEYLRAWAVRLLGEEPASITSAIHDAMVAQAQTEPSPFVRRHLASLLQRLPHDRAWPLAERLAARTEDAEDSLLPLMIWYGLEPLVAQNPSRGLALAQSTPIGKLKDFVIRRVAAIPGGYQTALQFATDPAMAEIVVAALAAQLADEAKTPMPPAWSQVYTLLKDSEKPEVKRHLLTLAGKFGDHSLLPEFRQLLSNPDASPDLRQAALQTLVDARDTEAVSVLHDLVRGPESPLRSAAISALASLPHPQNASVLLSAYPELTAQDQSAVITTLTSREDSTLALLQAIGSGTIPRQDLGAVAARQILQFESPAVKEALEKHWGSFQASSESKSHAIEAWRQKLTPETLAQADLANGRRLFNQSCFACHVLFGQGMNLGPDITGANRADLDYLLENIVDPNSVVPLDYQLVIFTMKDGAVISGMIRKESESAFTVALPGGTESTVPKADILRRETLPQSLMPEGMLDVLQPDEARDLIAYLQSEKQVRLALPGERIFEGETLLAKEKTGNAAPQSMSAFSEDQWSGQSQLWWTGARPGDQLHLEFNVEQEGHYNLAAVMTKARDYGKFSLALNQPENQLLEEIDLFEPRRVITTGEVALGTHSLKAGTHLLIVSLLGKHPQADPSYMFGLDYLQLVPAPQPTAP